MMQTQTYRHTLALLFALALSAPAMAGNTAVKPVDNKPPVKAATTTPPVTAGSADDCVKDGPATAPANSGGGVGNSQGASVKMPPKPKCPVPKVVKTQ